MALDVTLELRGLNLFQHDMELCEDRIREGWSGRALENLNPDEQLQDKLYINAIKSTNFSEEQRFISERRLSRECVLKQKHPS